MATKTFRGIGAGGVQELIEMFGDRVTRWDKVRGDADVEFDTEEEAEWFEQHHEWAE